MKNLKYFLVIILTLLIVGCSQEDNDIVDNSEKVVKTLKIGTSSVSKDLAESGKEILERKGYNVEIVIFDDYVLPNDALVEGSLHANFYQHEPYMNNYNKSHDTDIIMLEPKLYNFYTGLYSVKAETIEELPKGGFVGIAQDASNISIQLEQLDEVGIITLPEKPNSGEFYTFADIIDNPYNYEFIESDHNKYLNMEDYSIVIGTSNTMAEYGVDPTENLLKKFVNDDYAQGICVLEKNIDTEWAKDIIEAYSSKEAIEKVPKSTGFEYIND